MPMANYLVLLCCALCLRTLEAFTGSILTVDERTDVVQWHNEERRRAMDGELYNYPRAGFLPDMAWDDNLAQSALIEVQRKDGDSENCLLAHYLGVKNAESLSVAFNPAEPLLSLVNAWTQEQWGYSWVNNECNYVKSPNSCGHYFAMVNEGYNRVGCAIVRDCPQTRKVKLICQYRTEGVASWNAIQGRPFDCFNGNCELKSTDDIVYPDCVSVTSDFKLNGLYSYQDNIWDRPYWYNPEGFYLYFQGTKWVIYTELSAPGTSNNAYCYNNALLPQDCLWNDPSTKASDASGEGCASSVAMTLSPTLSPTVPVVGDPNPCVKAFGFPEPNANLNGYYKEVGNTNEWVSSSGLKLYPSRPGKRWGITDGANLQALKLGATYTDETGDWYPRNTICNPTPAWCQWSTAKTVYEADCSDGSSALAAPMMPDMAMWESQPAQQVSWQWVLLAAVAGCLTAMLFAMARSCLFTKEVEVWVPDGVKDAVC